MIGLVLAIQKVELVSDESWASQNSALVLALAALGAASLAAMVAIVTQRWQLAHDRSLRKQDQTLDAIDAAITGVNDANDAVIEFGAAVTGFEAFRDHPQLAKGNAQEWQSAADEKRDLALPRLMTLRGMGFKLETRLGRDHPIVACFDSARVAANERYTHFLPGVHGNRAEEQRGGDKSRMEAARDTLFELQSACYTWFVEEASGRLKKAGKQPSPDTVQP